MDQSKTRIGILGAGDFGNCLAWLVTRNGFKVKIYSKSKDRYNKPVSAFSGSRTDSPLKMTSNLEEVIYFSDLLFLAVPTSGVRRMAKAARNFAFSGIIINCAKGLEPRTGLRMSQVLSQECPRDLSFGSISGPNFSSEIMHEIPTASIVATNQEHVVILCQRILNNKFYRVYGSYDLPGVELGGAFKNILAIGSGINDGLGLGNNSKAILVTRGIKEMVRLSIALGAKRETLMGISGVGDIMLSCWSNLSRNYRLGQLIGQGFSLESALRKINRTIEGVETTRCAVSLAVQYEVKSPIFEKIYNILFEDHSAEEIIPFGQD